MSDRTTINQQQQEAVFAALTHPFTAGPQNLVLNRRAPLLYFLEQEQQDKRVSQVHFADLTDALSSRAPEADDKGTIAWAKIPVDERCATGRREQTKEELLLQERQRVFGHGVTSFDYFEE